MTIITVGKTEYEFPDNFTDQQIKDILTKQKIIKPLTKQKPEKFTQRQQELIPEIKGVQRETFDPGPTKETTLKGLKGLLTAASFIPTPAGLATKSLIMAPKGLKTLSKIAAETPTILKP